MTRFKILSITHVAAGLSLLPLSMTFGLILAPVLVVGSLWIAALGFLLWRPNARALSVARRTHLIGGIVAVLLFAHGILALRAGEGSLAEDGGLFGGFALIPIAYGLMLGAVSIGSLFTARSRGG